MCENVCNIRTLSQFIGRHPAKSLYKPGSHEFQLKCFDKFGNAHTVGGRIKKAVVRGAGQLYVGSVPNLEAIENAPPRQDIECKVQHMSSGRYSLKCFIQGAGFHPLLVMDAQGKAACMAIIHVKSDRIWPPHCWLHPQNSYKSPPNRIFTCYIYLYDRYFNPCFSFTSDTSVTVLLGSQLLSAALVQSPPTPCCGAFQIKFTPQITGTSSELLKIFINNCPIGDDPKTFHITEEMSFQERLCHLRSTTDREGVMLPIVTIDRSNILESTLQNLTVLDFKFRVRFVGESGIDTGGMSR